MQAKAAAMKDWDYRFPWAIGVLQTLKAEKIETVFDVGSGDGVLKREIENLGLLYRGYDIEARSNVKAWNIEQHFPYEERPDAVVFLEVIEHLNNPWLGVKNISALLPEGGYLILSTPNPAWSDSRISLFRKGVLTMFTQDDLTENHHVFTPWKHVIVKLLCDNGFEICRCENIGHKTRLTAQPFWSLKLPVRLLFRGLKRFIERKDGDAIGSLYGIVAKKIQQASLLWINTLTTLLIYEGEQGSYCLL